MKSRDPAKDAARSRNRAALAYAFAQEPSSPNGWPMWASGMLLDQEQ
jgi:hypothetical protein